MGQSQGHGCTCSVRLCPLRLASPLAPLSARSGACLRRRQPPIYRGLCRKSCGLARPGAWSSSTSGLHLSPAQRVVLLNEEGCQPLTGASTHVEQLAGTQRLLLNTSRTSCRRVLLPRRGSKCLTAKVVIPMYLSTYRLYNIPEL